MALPTKSELLQGELVDFTVNHKNVTTNTLKIAEALGKRHHDITRKVDSLVKKGLIGKRELSLIYFVDSANREQKAYELNEEPALQVVMGLSGKRVELLHKEIAQSFVAMKSELHDWKTGRYLASDTTKIASDAIHRLGIRLSNEHPKSGKGRLIHIHFQSAMSRAVTGKTKVNRNEFTKEQLVQLAMLEIAVNDAIEARTKEDSMVVRDDVLAMINATAEKETRNGKQTEMSLI